VSHIAAFRLKVDNINRLRLALDMLGCTIHEGKMKNYGGSWITSQSGKEVVLGFGIKAKTGNYTYDRFGFVKEKDETLALVGDTYGIGRSQEEISGAIENAYINAAVEEAYSDMRMMGFVEDFVDVNNTVQLVSLA
jgi:hypothetical protein